MLTRERRTITGHLELRTVTAEEKTAGYIGALEGVIPFNTDSQVLRDRSLNSGRPFIERIAPAAFTRSLAEVKDIMAFVGHTDDPLAAFARIGENLTFTATPAALQYRALLPDTATGRDLATLAEKRIIRGTSFEFDRGATDQWEKRDGQDVRTVTAGTLRTVNPVAWPAYDGSELTVSLRSKAARALSCYSDAEFDPTCTDDQCYAACALAGELEEMTAAQDYLRANPAGALAAYATAAVTDCVAEIQTLLTWLAANGATPAENALTARARERLAEQQPVTFSAKTASAREERLRIFSR